jgi:asparagine synthase (glutamine-hydrolysing)
MCGIAGFWGRPDRPLLEAMAAIQRHRGPDDDGFLETEHASLGFRRLQIIDLDTGQQPMGGEDAAVQVVFNGEVYNYRELRAELVAAGHVFRTQSDTESIVHAYEEWGTNCFRRFNGMWSVAILDGRDAAAPRLVLARDHFGIKPLYWTQTAERVLFASEVKALLCDPAVRPEPDPQTIHTYLLSGIHDRDDRTFFAGVRQVPNGAFAVIDDSGVRVEKFWTPELREDGDPDPQTFRRLFMASVERRLVADVPVGTCLSGGLDSSSIVGAMTELLQRHAPDSTSLGDRLQTFSAVFDNDPIDERDYIEVVLRASGARSTYVRPSSEQFYSELEQFIWHLEEPTVSSAPYAQWCVMREARKQVTVLLDGQGGDELLAGYVPYQTYYLRELLRRRRWGTLVREAWAARDILLPFVRRTMRERSKQLVPKNYLRQEFSATVEPLHDPRRRDDLKQRLLQDLLGYSLPSALRYEDHMSMAHSLEARLPFLDQQLVEWVLTLPSAAIIRNGWSRAILRDGLRDLLPDRIRRRRRKIGFTTPEMRWHMARRVHVQSLLRSPSFCARPFWRGIDIAEAWSAACRGEVDASLFFWRVMCIELWLRVFVDEPGRNGPPESHVAVGDRRAAALVGATAEQARRGLGSGNGRHLFATALDGRRVFARSPLRSPVIRSGDRLEAALDVAIGDLTAKGEGLCPGDVVAVCEKVVAISQGRSHPVSEVRASMLARVLAHFVRRTASGIGLGLPATMQLAIEEVGAARILFATAASAITRPLGIRGMFYRVAGGNVSSIDGPTPHTLPPYNTHAKRPPLDPAGVAAQLAGVLSARAGGRVDVAIIDSNDVGAAVLGASDGVDEELLLSLLRDNPMGQEDQQTPFLLVRMVGVLEPDAEQRVVASRRRRVPVRRLRSAAVGPAAPPAQPAVATDPAPATAVRPGSGYAAPLGRSSGS